ncbi:MAG: hypothetical protein WD737_05630 [Gemmatimonadota bacterium]
MKMVSARWQQAGATPAPPRTRLALLASTFLLLAACGGQELPGSDEESPDGAAAASDTGPLPVGSRPAAEIFPPTATRGLVLNRCGSCHAVACAAIGQRDEQRWRAVETSHADYVPSLSTEDQARIFSYLRMHFGTDRPEPDVPVEYLEGGCPRL